MVIAGVLGLHGIPRPDKITHADTGDELPETVAHVEKFGNWLADRGHTLEVVRFKSGGRTWSISQTVERRHATGKGWVPSLPVWTAITGRGEQFCTADFKTKLIDRSTRRATRGMNVDVEVCVGFTVEEIMRIKRRPKTWPASWRWGHPLIMSGLNRGACRAINEAHLSWPVPPSACVFCPHRATVGPASYDWIRRTRPETWAKIVRFDEMIRHSLPGLKREAYLTHHLLPINEAVDASLKQGTLFGGGMTGAEGCDEGGCWV